MKIYNYAQLIKKSLFIICRTSHFHSVFSVTILGNLRSKGKLLWLKFSFLYIQAACSQFSLYIMASSPDMMIKKAESSVFVAIWTHTHFEFYFSCWTTQPSICLSLIFFWQSPNARARACSCVPPSPLFLWRIEEEGGDLHSGHVFSCSPLVSTSQEPRQSERQHDAGKAIRL